MVRTYGGGLTASVTANITDDGTFYILQDGSGNILLKIRKSDGQLLIAGGLSTDETL